MAKTRKRRKSQPAGKRPLPKLAREVSAAMQLFEDGNPLAAHHELLRLSHQYPRSVPVLYALLEVSQEIEDWRTIAFCGEQLLPLVRGEERADILNNLMVAHVKLNHSALAWHYARELVAQYPHYTHIKQVHTFVEIANPLIEQEIEETMGDTGFTQEEKIELRILHDRVRFLTESSRYAEAIEAAEQLLEKMPTMLPVLNNLSMSQFMVGDVSAAITTAQNVLAQAPDNFHALGNLVRFHVLTGQFEPAQVYASQLEQVHSDSLDLPTKQAEAFAFLGDDANVWAAYERAKASDAPMNPLLLHLAAVASFRLGEEKRAWKLWQQADSLFPHFEMVEGSLAERRLPTGERHVPWYWPFGYWFPQDFNQLLEKYLGRATRLNDNEILQAMNGLLAERPYLPQLFPHILERGDRAAREFVVTFIRVLHTPELVPILYTFAQSPYGPDALRLDASQIVSRHQPSLLPENRQMPMWIKGKQTEIFQLGFEISDEPELWDGVSHEILDKYAETYDLLVAGESDAAEPLLHEIIAAAPHFYSAYNQLAVVYERQGRRQEARALVEDTHARFPDYLFARAALSQFLAQDGRIEEAREMIAPLLRLTRLHISEFKALARAQMGIALADNQPDAARAWLEMWRDVDEDDPELRHWQIRLEGPGKLLDGFQNLMKRRRKK